MLPFELRQRFDMPVGQPLEIITDEDKLILAKYEPKCVFCGAAAEWMFHERPVCEACREELKTRIKVN